MAFTAEQLAEIKQQKAENRTPVASDGVVDGQQETEESRGFFSVLNDAKDAASYGFGQGLANTANVAQAVGATFMNRNIEAGRSLMKGDILGALNSAARATNFLSPDLPVNLLYRVVPAEFVNKIHPLQGVIPLPDGTWNKKAEDKFGKMPKTDNSVASALNSGMAAIGDSATMPIGGLFKAAIGGKVVQETTKAFLGRLGSAGGRDVSAAMGSGAGGYAGGEIASGLTEEFGGGETAQAGARAIGGLLGGVAGGVAGSTRPGLFVEGGKAGVGAIKTGYGKAKDLTIAAYETAKRIGDVNRTKSLRETFRGELEKLVPVDQQRVMKVLEDYIAESAALDPNLRSAYQRAYGALKQQGLSDDEIQSTWRVSQLTGHEPTKALEEVGERLAPASDVVKIQATKRATEKRTAEVIEGAFDAPLKKNADMERAYTRFTGKPYSGALEAAKNARRYFQEAEAAAKGRAMAVANEMQPLDPNREFNLGEQVRAAQANLLKRGESGGLWEKKQKFFNDAGEELAKQEANVEPLVKLLAEKSALIGPRTTSLKVGSQTKEATGIDAPSLVDDLERIDPAVGSQIKAFIESSKTRTATLQTIFEARKAVSGRMNELYGNPLADSKNQLLMEVHATLDGMLKNQASGTALQKLSEADKFYSEVYAPVARNGLPGKLVRRSKQLQAGEDLMPSSKVLAEFTRSPEGMHDFQRLADGKLTGQRLDGMYQALEAHTRGSLGEKIKNGAIDYDEYVKWKRNNAHVLEAIPEEAARIEQRVARMIQANDQADRNAARVKNIFGGPISSSIGLDRAKEMLVEALPSEKKMAFLVSITKNNALKAGDKSKGLVPLIEEVKAMMSPYTGGNYDAAKARQFFKDAEPGLMVLFSEALGGRVAATRHLNNVRDLLDLQVNVGKSSGLIPPAKFGQYEDPLAGVGLSIPQATSYARGVQLNHTSPLYTAVLLGSKAVGARTKIAVNKAMEELVTNPKKANAMLKMHLETNEGRLPSKEVIEDALGVGAYDRLMDGAKTIGARTKQALATDEIGLHILRGALIGPGGAYREDE